MEVPAIIQFPPLLEFPWLIHGFIPRVGEIHVQSSKEEALKALRPVHQRILDREGIRWDHLQQAEQVHGREVAWIESPASKSPSPGVDGLMTQELEVPLGIFVADCCVVYLVDSRNKAFALLHSGKKGTEMNIVEEGINRMEERFQTLPADLVAMLSPCIHSCCYEMDLASEIENQLQDEGVARIYISQDCTACRLDRYYSYRKEKGQTGRMLAFAMKHS